MQKKSTIKHSVFEFEHNKHLVFCIEENNYAIPVAKLDGVIGVRQITKLYNKSGILKGVLKVNKLDVPILDLNLILNNSQKKPADNACVVLVKAPAEFPKILIGFIVDSVTDLFNFSHLSVDKKSISFLDIDKIITSKEISAAINLPTQYENAN